MLLTIKYQVGTLSDLCLKSVASSHYASRLQAALSTCIPEHTNSGSIVNYSKRAAAKLRLVHTLHNQNTKLFFHQSFFNSKF